jgi:hypothetical protein
MDLWAACRETLAIGALRGSLRRVVESQEQVATRGLVDDLAEQDLLETLLERSKPPQPTATRGLHYLLAAPFRYPPLRHGSRFGSRFEPSLLYGSHETRTALAETAHYRGLFWRHMQTPPSAPLLTQHTLFGAEYATPSGVALQDPPCDSHRPALTHPGDYGPTQALGAALRREGVEALEFVSARDPGQGINVALFLPTALAGTRPSFQEAWLCETGATGVVFSAVGRREMHRFPPET